MKILLYSMSSPHEITGIGKYNGELLEWLWEKDHIVDAVTSLPYYPYWEIYDGYKKDQYKVEKFSGGNIYSVRLPVSKNVSSLRRVWIDFVMMLKTFLKVPYLSYKNKYDVIILVLPPLAIFPVSILAKYLGKSKLHVHIQDLQIEAAREMELLPKPVLYILESIERTCLYFADFVSSISESMVSQVKNKYKSYSKKTKVIENWADTDTIKPVLEKEWLKKNYSYEENTFLVVYSGNIGEKQGLEQILPVAKKLQMQEEIQFLILGDGASKITLVNKCEELQLKNVKFGDLVPKEKLNLMLNGSDVQLIIQRKEASDSFLPSKYINILSAGIPSIVTAFNGTELYKLANKNDVSELVTPEDTVGLCEAIETLYYNSSRRDELSENSRNLALRKFGRDAILNRLMTYYINLIE